MAEPEIIVVGGGLGGLCTAALLAAAGRRVRVLERASHAGGRARSRSEAGFVHNIGAHALYRGGPAVEVLRALGVEPRGRPTGGPGACVLQGDALHALPSGMLSLLSTSALGPRGKLEFSRVLLALSERKAQQMRGVSVREWLDAELTDARARSLLEAFVRLTAYAHAPEVLGADAAIRQLGYAVRNGVMYVDGGWQTLVDAVMQRARELGVQIEFGCAVERIECAQEPAGGRRASAVWIEHGRRLPAAHVIAALDPPALAALLADDAHARRWADTCVPLRAACLDLGVRALAHPERWFAMATDAPLYLADHAAFARVAPEGAHTLHAVRYLAPGEDGRSVEGELRAFLERVQPGAYAAAETRRFLPNLTVHNAVPGSARATSAHPAIGGLHIVGDWVARSHMLLDAVLASAREVAAQAQAETGVAQPAAVLAGQGLARRAAARDARQDV